MVISAQASSQSYARGAAPDASEAQAARAAAASVASDDEATVVVARGGILRAPPGRSFGDAAHRQAASAPDTVVVARVRPAPRDEVREYPSFSPRLMGLNLGLKG